MFLVLAAAKLHQPDGVGSRLSSLAEYALRYSHAPSSLFLGLCCLCCRYVCDDVSKVTFRHGLGRVWTPSVIFRTLSPICTLIRTRTLFCFPLLFGSLYCIYLDLGSLESLLYIYICSFGLYRELLWCNHLWSIPPALRACLDVHVMFRGRLRNGSMRSLAGIAKTA